MFANIVRSLDNAPFALSVDTEVGHAEPGMLAQKILLAHCSV